MILFTSFHKPRLTWLVVYYCLTAQKKHSHLLFCNRQGESVSLDRGQAIYHIGSHKSS